MGWINFSDISNKLPPTQHSFIHIVDQFAHAKTVNSELVKRAAAPPVICAMKDGRDANNAIYATHRNAIMHRERSNIVGGPPREP